MSTTLDDRNTTTQYAAAERLRATMAAMRVSFTWFGTRKTLTPAQKATAAESFGAQGDFLSAGKKLVDTQHPLFKAVTAVRNRCLAYWKSVSLPYPEEGVRLIRQPALERVDQQMESFRRDLDEAVSQLAVHFHELQTAARTRLGQLYCEQDYPTSLHGLFAMTWDYPSLEVPSYLAQLNPARYEEECRRVSARFDEAVELTERMFMDELAHLVAHLTERLSGAADGAPKIFRDSAVENLREFFERFRTLNIRSNAQLDQLVDQCQRVVRGVEPQQLRDNQTLRRQVATKLSSVASVLDGLLVDRPRRRILRSAQ